MPAAVSRTGHRRALLVIGTLLGVLAGEALCRVIYVRPWFDGLGAAGPGADWRAGVRLNALGLRDRDYPAIKPANTRRVLLLGDSFTFGLGVADESAIFPALLEARLNQGLNERGLNVELLNGGIPGSLTASWVKLLSAVGDSFQPDLIVIVFFLRDGTRTTANDSFFVPIREEIVAARQRSVLYPRLYLYRIWADHRDRQLIARKYSTALLDSYSGDSQQTQEWQAAQANMRFIQEYGKRRHVTVALAVFPLLAELSGNYPFQPISNEILRFGTEAGMPVLDLLPAFAGQDAATLWVAPADQHPNARGHELAAGALLPFVRGLILDDPPAHP